MAKKGGKSSDNQASFHGGLNFKQFRKIGHVPLEMNDISWAGRLFTKAPYWTKTLSRLISVFLITSVVALGATWVSVLMRKPALLLGVYPNGETICFPRLRTSTGEPSPIHPSYDILCSKLAARIGRKWQTDNAQKKESGRHEVGDITNKVVYREVGEILASLPQNQQNQLPSPAYRLPDGTYPKQIPNPDPSLPPITIPQPSVTY